MPEAKRDPDDSRSTELSRAYHNGVPIDAGFRSRQAPHVGDPFQAGPTVMAAVRAQREYEIFRGERRQRAAADSDRGAPLPQRGEGNLHPEIARQQPPVQLDDVAVVAEVVVLGVEGRKPAALL